MTKNKRQEVEGKSGKREESIRSIILSNWDKILRSPQGGFLDTVFNRLELNLYLLLVAFYRRLFTFAFN